MAARHTASRDLPAGRGWCRGTRRCAATVATRRRAATTRRRCARRGAATTRRGAATTRHRTATRRSISLSNRGGSLRRRVDDQLGLIHHVQVVIFFNDGTGRAWAVRRDKTQCATSPDCAWAVGRTTAHAARRTLQHLQARGTACPMRKPALTAQTAWRTTRRRYHQRAPAGNTNNNKDERHNMTTTKRTYNKL